MTFCNKTNPRTEEILITKNFTGLNGYVPVAGDVPSFTLNPSANTSCAAPVQQQNDTWTVECTVPAGWSGTGTVTETPKPNWQQCPIDALQGGLIAELSGLVNEVMSIVKPYAKQFTFCNYPVGRVIVQKNDNTSNTNTGRPAQWNFEVDGSQTYSRSSLSVVAGDHDQRPVRQLHRQRDERPLRPVDLPGLGQPERQWLHLN